MPQDDFLEAIRFFARRGDLRRIAMMYRLMIIAGVSRSIQRTLRRRLPPILLNIYLEAKNDTTRDRIRKWSMHSNRWTEYAQGIRSHADRFGVLNSIMNAAIDESNQYVGFSDENDRAS